jgi:DNA uptake protein ComE-like DNA-binding protein
LGKERNDTYPIYKIVKHSREKVVKDINSATQEDLMKVYGIGQVLSERI